MASFDIFGPPTKEGIKVGYISTERGMVDGVSILDANKHAKKDPGTVFIYKARGTKTTKFLNINEVNALQPTDADIPDSCEDGLKLESPPEDAKIVFMGGGGVGVRANPIIGRDGAVLGVDLVSGGFGYEYPPLAEVRDDSEIGAGAVLRVITGEQIETEIIYSDEEDFEEYIIPDEDKPGWGDQYTPGGKLLGPWTPEQYGKGSDLFDRQVNQFIQQLNNSGKGWWHTRMHPPLKITSDGKTTRTVYNMDNKPYWHPFLNTYGISPKPRSNAKPSSFAGQWFTFEWDQEFPYDGEYKFRAQCDNKAKLYIDNKPISVFQIGFGGAAGHVLSNPATVKETVKKGRHNIRLELYNNPIMEKVAEQQPPPPTSSEVEFKVTTASMFGNGVKIEGLNLNIAQENAIAGHVPPINETFKRDVKFGEKYKVIFTSDANYPGGGMPLTFNGLKVPGDKRFVNPKRLEFDDNSANGFDVNASFTIDKGDVTFSPDGTKLVGKGEVTLTYSWNDLPDVAGKSLESIKIGNTLWVQSNARNGSQTHTINIGPRPVEGSKIKLRTKGDTIVQMEDYVDTSWDDLVISASTGKFTDLKGNIAYFHVPHPPTKKITPKAKSTDTKGEQTRTVFNTVDYIDRANRKLWRTNIYSRGGFLNDYGICPFDTKLELKDNPYAGDHKIVWPSVNFPIDGNYDIEVMVDDNVDITLSKGSGQDDIRITKKGFLEGTSISTGKLKVTRFIKQGVYSITADLNQLAGGSFAFRPPSNLPTTAGVNFIVTTSSLFADKITIPGLFSAGKGYGEELSGTQSLTKQVEIEKDYDVILNSEQSNTIKIRIHEDGKRLEMEDLPDQVAGSRGSTFFDDLICTVSEGIFHSPQGDRCKFRVDRSFKGINPMALAINIQTSFAEKEIETRTAFNENPMAVALMIDAPPPPIPQQEIPKEEDSRCPNNPFWSSRFPGGSKSWYPVRFDSWGEFHNKYGMSPIPPYDDESTSGGGLTWENIWTKEVPYSGFFKIKMMADDVGEFWVDDKRILETSMLQKRSYGEKLFFIEKGLRKLKLVVGNNSYETTKMLKTQVFNTLDWISGKSAKIKSKQVRFKITSSSVFANSIRIDELGIFERKEFTPEKEWYNASWQINANLEREVEVNKIYEVRLASSRVGANREWDIKYNNLHPANSTIRVTRGNKRIELLDGHDTDTNFALEIDSGNVKFTNDGRRLIVQGKDAKITASWKDNPGTAGVAVDSVKIKGKTFRRSGTRGSQTETFIFNDNPDINLRTVGDSILQMEDYTDNSFDDLICAASEGRFFDLEKDKCKFMIEGGTEVSGGVTSGLTRKGATYSGPHLFHYQDSRWGKIINREGVSPIGSPTQSLSEDNPNILGKKIMTWKGVDFPETGDYQVSFIADDIGVLYIGESSIPKMKSTTNEHSDSGFKANDYTYETIKMTKGKHDIKVELTNFWTNGKFLENPTGFALKINANIEVGTGITRSWLQNPVSVSAVLIPPPCPRKIKGKGVVTEVIVDDPGNGYPPPKGGDYDALLQLEDINITSSGINYSPEDEVIISGGGGERGDEDTGAKASLCEGVGPFGEIQKICIDDPGTGFTGVPDIRIVSDTGVNFEGSSIFKVVRDPIVPDPDKLIQVTDLVGIKQTGYYRGRPYYGAVFYQDNVKYAGWYETAGELVQIYDTLQESIDAEVTTPASAILRQGSDVSSNDKRLNLPGTPENLT